MKIDHNRYKASISIIFIYETLAITFTLGKMGLNNFVVPSNDTRSNYVASLDLPTSTTTFLTWNISYASEYTIYTFYSSGLSVLRVKNNLKYFRPKGRRMDMVEGWDTCM